MPPYITSVSSSQRGVKVCSSLLDHPEGRRLCYPDSLLPRGPALEKSPDDRPLSRKSNELRIGQNSGG
ncbi:hypothetical protein TNCV_3581461 [Trichonephila clavipes]|nr:hypothetical protein TNCV_3581461 [Trichonephila clavipes]